MKIEYKIADANTKTRLECAVNDAIIYGWKPVGGVCKDYNNNFYQAMIRESKD